MAQPGKHNCLTDVEGVQVGHYHQSRAVCGVSAVLCPQGAVAGVDVRGSSPATRETDLLNPVHMVQKVQAVVLSGGSVYGLACADGVVRWLAARGLGFDLGGGQVAPIVPAAAHFDLGRGPDFVPPIGPDWGREACQAAQEGPLAQGNVGAGMGAVSGGIKGGLGSASEVLDNGLTVGALVVVNSLGSILDANSGLPWELRLELADEFGPLARGPRRPPAPAPGRQGGHTTIGVVATDAALDKAQATKLAQMAQDGLARAIRPAHTMFDGDAVFSLATGRRALPGGQGFFAVAQAADINQLGRAAADCLARAVIQGVLKAKSLAGFTAWRDLEPL